jgi:outer membrane receptor protein involved in Fe transport
MKTRFKLAAISLSVLVLLSAIPRNVFGQATSGAILGTVNDSNGAVITEATIKATNIQTGFARTATTDGEGRYRIQLLPLGKYEVKAEHAGFASEVRSGIELTVGRDAVLDFTLKAGKVEESVVIVGEASLVETTNSSLTGFVGERRIHELPLNGRDVFQLSTLQVGVINTAGLTTGDTIDVGPGTSKIAVNGSRITSNSFLLDGTWLNDAYNNTPGPVSGGFSAADTIQEFQIITNNFSAEYGGAGGAVITAVSKSGTNKFHGTAFEFLRNSALDARNFFDPGDVPPFKRNQFGGTIGGPIIKNKTFFFASYEGLQERLGVTRRFAVPTEAARARAVPKVVPYVNLYPMPNGEDLGNGAAFYLRAGNDKTTDNFVTGRVDHIISGKDTLFGRYTFDDSSQTLQNEVIQDSITDGRNQYLTLGENHIFSPTLLNSFRFGFNRSVINADKPFIQDTTSLGFIPGHRLGSFFGISEVAPLGSNIFTPRFFAYNQYEYSDHLVISQGAHSIKTGFTGRRMQLNALSNLTVDGIYIYFGLPGVSTLDAFLLGLPAAFVAPTPGSDFYRGIRESIFGFYGQDDWKVTPKLTVNLGLRYEFFTTPTEVNGKISNLRSVTDPAPTVGEPFIDNPSKKNFAPRIGFAYDPFGDGKTSIRAGYGIFDIMIYPFNYRFEMSNQPPYASTALVIGPPPFFFPAPFPNAFDAIASPVPQKLSVNSFDFNPARSYMQQYNLSVQREVLPSYVLTVSYVGSRGVHLARRNDTNQRTDWFIQDGRKFFPVLPPGVPPESKRLNPNLASIRHMFWDANSTYNALQVKLDKRYTHGLDFQASYTYSRALDDASDTETTFANQAPGARLQDSFDTRSERGLASFDVRHNFVFSATYELPTNKSFKGITDKLLNGWETTAILTAHSGFPFGLFLGFDRANDASADNVAQRPDIVPGRSYGSAITGKVERYVDPSAFQLPPENSYGNSARNPLIGPGLATFDLGLFKNTDVTEGFKIQFRAEAFNLFNRANFAIPEDLVIFPDSSGVVPGNFGRITRTSTSSRQLQFAIKFVF